MALLFARGYLWWVGFNGTVEPSYYMSINWISPGLEFKGVIHLGIRRFGGSR